MGTRFRGCGTLGVVRLEIDNSTGSFLDRTHPAWQVYQRSLQEFGGDEILVVAIEGDSPFDTRVLDRVRELSAELSAVPGIQRVDSVSTVPLIWTEPDGSIDFDPAVIDFDLAANFDRILRKLQHDRIASDSLVSEDGRVFAINLVLDEDVDAGRTTVVAAVSKLLADDRAWLSGVPIFRIEVDSRTRDELAVFVPLTLFLVGAVVLIGFGRLSAVLIALGASAFGTWVVLGAMGAMGTPLSLSTMILPSILLALGCAYVMHVLTAARGVQSRAELETAIAGVVRYTTAGIALGFAALGFSEFTLVRNLGMITGFLVVLCLLADLTLLPALLVGRESDRQELPIW